MTTQQSYNKDIQEQEFGGASPVMEETKHSHMNRPLSAGAQIERLQRVDSLPATETDGAANASTKLLG